MMVASALAGYLVLEGSDIPKDINLRTEACRNCGCDFTQVRKRGQPRRYCERPECLEERRRAFRRSQIAKYRGSGDSGERTTINWRKVLLPEIVALSSQDPRYRAAKYAAQRGIVPFVCQNPSCGKTFERENKPGHPSHYCSRDCAEEANRIRTRLWHELNKDRRKDYLEATREERLRLYKEAWAKDAEFRNRTLRNAIRRARRRGMSPEETRADSRAVRRLRFALARGSREGDLVTYEELYERDGGICQLCFSPLPFEEATMDHTIPCSKGGSHTLANLVIAHVSCNSRKHAN